MRDSKALTPHLDGFLFKIDTIVEGSTNHELMTLIKSIIERRSLASFLYSDENGYNNFGTGKIIINDDGLHCYLLKRQVETLAIRYESIDLETKKSAYVADYYGEDCYYEFYLSIKILDLAQGFVGLTVIAELSHTLGEM